MQKETMEVLKCAQLDLAQLTRFVVGLDDTYNPEAIGTTLLELAEITGEPLEIQLAKDMTDPDWCP